MQPTDEAIREWAGGKIDFASIDIRPGRASDGGACLHAWADGRLIGQVITADDGAIMVKVSRRCLPRG